MTKPILEVKGLKKSFGNTEVLKGIDFTLNKGEVLTIIGSSGGGKTTLLRCLNFLEMADAGQIFINGEQIYDGIIDSHKSEEELRQCRLHFGLVFQSFNLFPQYTALENIMLAPKLLKLAPEEEIRENAMQLIGRIGLSSKIDNYPCQLSGGQQQRVAIARALALKPDILCFDEPTSALDPEITGEVLNVIRSLSTDLNMTMIIVTHEISFAKDVSSRIMFVDSGSIAEEGNPVQMIENPRSERLRSFLSSVKS